MYCLKTILASARRRVTHRLLFAFCTAVLLLGLTKYKKNRHENANDILDFNYQWCRMQKLRFAWKELIGDCLSEISWGERKTSSSERTSAENSYVTRWELQPSGKVFE